MSVYVDGVLDQSEPVTSGSVTVATRRPPPTSLAGSFTLAPESVTSLVEMAAAGASAGASALSEEMHGVDAVTRFFAGGAKAARLTLVDGLAGAVVSSRPHSAR